MPLNRRKFLKKSAVTGAGVAIAGAAVAPAQAAEAKKPGKPVKQPKRYALTVLGTTDLHGHVFNWDYFKDAEYKDAAGNAQGLARISTLVNRIRAEKGRENTLLVDAGDTIQGTPLTYYYAKVDPITAKGGPVHPMAQAMNAIGYDAAALGNHEFNYGIETLRKFESQLRFPLLGANAVDAKTLETGVPAVCDQDVLREGCAAGEGGGAGADEPGYRDLGQGVCAGQAGVPGAGGAGGEVGAEAEVAGCGCGDRVGAFGFVGYVVVR